MPKAATARNREDFEAVCSHSGEAPPMLGSHFDLAKEIKAITAKRCVDNRGSTDLANADLAFEDFDRTMTAFLGTVSPILLDRGLWPHAPHVGKD